MAVQRLRMFAGPNGSGKSTIKDLVPVNLFGHYLNPDDIEKEVRANGFYDARHLKLNCSTEEIVLFFAEHPLIRRIEDVDLITDIRFVQNGLIDFHSLGFNSYLSAILSDFLRKKLIRASQSFTFETVMSSPDKLDVLLNARNAGFRNYLYYVATEDPEINISRVEQRIKMGGHPVPKNKIIERFYRSLDLLLDAIRLTDRAYIFDNSGETHIWIAEVTDGRKIEMKSNSIPSWFKDYILDKL
jgi:predicted ABC-type ATPase